MRRRTARRLALIFILFAAVEDASAADGREISLDEMIDASDEIVVGQVTEMRSEWRGRVILSIATVEVDEALKGNPGRQVEIVQLGGTALHPTLGTMVTMTSSSSARFEVGEHVVVFARRSRPDWNGLVAGARSKLVVHEDPASGDPRVPGVPRRLRVEREGRDGTRVKAEISSLIELRQRVRARAGTRRGAQE